MIEVAHAILEEKGDVLPFADIVNEIQQFTEKSDREIRERLPQFYTDLNDDGSFISLGENVWGLRTWYPYDSIDEEVNHPEDADNVKAPTLKRVNAFLDDDDDDVVEYDDDTVDTTEEEEDADTQSTPDLSQFSHQDLSFDDDDDELVGDPDDDLEGGIEGNLSEFSADDDEDDDAE
ncbi:DNA-directed RNA polymerase subunit delta [Bombilactobacillus folatiphilus]|uniref:Probable DNA-directed RNA polymerase subunit delta n=1 Tax=Bombilactobacillus folatiphilus TaxID=2923362 RepID=A0ABY4PAZ8_9LACO|nr:DNA-directed RNA polymerase subunit delta [Bombilactobacillus folatiphilus]UQS82853.1 DNA-directed RNA polymerase subunit delta [Bombilactobacillus folatiphilus]